MTQIVKIGNISTQIRGVSYSKSDVIANMQDGYLPVLRANNIQEQGLVLDDFVYVPESKISEKQRILAGDVIIAVSSGSISLVGKAASAKEDINAGFGAFCKILRPNTELVDPRYFANYFQTQKYRQIISNLAAGANINNLKNEHLDDLEIPLPPLTEQRRIASILDQADELRQKRLQAIEKLDQLLQATFIDMFGDPVSNSKKWTEKTLGEVVVFNTGKLDSNAAEENGIYPFFTCSRTPFAINTYAFDIEALLLAGNNAAGQYWVKHYKGKFNAYQRTYVLTIKDSLCTYGYLRYVLQFLLGFLQRMSKGSSTKYLTLSILKPIKIPIPPLELQRKFIQFYENIDSQNQLLMRNEIEFSKLFFTLQNQAFNGTL